jgi:CRP-like cAMP-binding protein
MEKRTPLGENRLLNLFSVADSAVIQTSLKKVPLIQGTVLYSSGDRIDQVYFPVSGMVSLLVVMKSGQQIETGIIGREGLVGGSIGYGGLASSGQATVQIEGSAWQVSSSKFLSLFKESAGLRKLVTDFQEAILFQAQQSSACHAVHTVEARLCRWLLQCQDVTQSDVIVLTQEFLSHMLGVQRNAVSLSAHKLQEAGLITYSRGTIKILDRAGLKASSCECYGAIRDYLDKAFPPLIVVPPSSVA